MGNPKGCVPWNKGVPHSAETRARISRARRGQGTRQAKDGLTFGQRHYAGLRSAAFDHYGWFCACCGEATPEFLTIDHIKGREGVKRMPTYWWLKKMGYPTGFQTMCWNCNCAKGMNGRCPHQIATTALFCPQRQHNAVTAGG